MHCRRYDEMYTLVIETSSGKGEWRVDRINLIVAKSHWRPTADIYETDDQYVFEIEVPGIDPEKIEISIYRNALVIAGDRKLKPFTSKGKFHLAEIRQGPFCFEFPLAERIDLDNIDMNYEDGILSVVLNKI
jgi:HSP20 family protein